MLQAFSEMSVNLSTKKSHKRLLKTFHFFPGQQKKHWRNEIGLSYWQSAETRTKKKFRFTFKTFLFLQQQKLCEWIAEKISIKRKKLEKQESCIGKQSLKTIKMLL